MSNWCKAYDIAAVSRVNIFIRLLVTSILAAWLYAMIAMTLAPRRVLLHPNVHSSCSLLARSCQLWSAAL